MRRCPGVGGHLGWTRGFAGGVDACDEPRGAQLPHSIAHWRLAGTVCFLLQSSRLQA